MRYMNLPVHLMPPYLKRIILCESEWSVNCYGSPLLLSACQWGMTGRDIYKMPGKPCVQQMLYTSTYERFFPPYKLNLHPTFFFHIAVSFLSTTFHKAVALTKSYYLQYGEDHLHYQIQTHTYRQSLVPFSYDITIQPIRCVNLMILPIFNHACPKFHSTVSLTLTHPYGYCTVR